MKKIVALVLSLVMALSLCTVAFGVTKTTGKVMYSYNATTNEFVGEPVSVKFVDGKTNTDGSGTINYYVFESGASKNYFVPCEKDAADEMWGVFNNGAQVCWAMFVGSDDDGLEAVKYDFKVTAQKATTALPNCTTAQYLVDGYLDADGNFYVKADAGEYTVNYNGILIKVDDAVAGINADVIYASHIFAKGVENTKTGYDVATCLICKGEFACTNDVAVATKNGYKISTGFSYDSAAAELVYEENYYDNGYDFKWGQAYAGNYEYCWQLKAGTTEEIGTAATETTTGVESAKTFDAGIAMYVGMSLMSVAGTAVVIGKKKEF